MPDDSLPEGFIRFGETTVGRCLVCEATDYVSNFVRLGCSNCGAPRSVEQKKGI